MIFDKVVIRSLQRSRASGRIQTSVSTGVPAVTDLETMLLNWLPVGTVMEEDAASPNPSADFAEGCFSCGVLTHTTDQCQTLDESFPFCLRDGRRNASETRETDPGRGVGRPDQ